MKWKLIKLASAAIALVAVVAAGRHVSRVLGVASAYYAKTLCSGVFVAGRGERVVVEEDLLPDMTREFARFHGDVDREQGLVTSSIFGLSERQALYRPGLGCTLVSGTTVAALRAQAEGFTPLVPPVNAADPWPDGKFVDTANLPASIDRSKLAKAIEVAFSEPRERTLRRTRAVVVVYRGKIIAEKYAAGIEPGTPLLGWSMGKSIAGALAGILVGMDKFSLDATGLHMEWQAQGDPRAGITLDNLLRMTSGLDFDPPHAKMLSDVRKMLFVKRDAAAYARAQPPVSPPGGSWIYGSGSTIVLSDLLRRAVGGTLKEYFNFPRRALFAPLGMTSAVIEPDASGTFLAPAFVYATARDWARFGLFLLNDGVWQGDRILPEGWVSYLAKPTPRSAGFYGAHVWRKVPGFLRPPYATEVPLPEDRFYMLGHDGQMVAIIPSRDLVVVRLGLSRRRGSWDPDEFVFDVLAAIPDSR